MNPTNTLAAALAFSLLAGPCSVLCAAGGPSANSPEPRNSLGIGIGLPQTVALTYERQLEPGFALRLHAGTFFLISSAGGRLQWERGKHRYRPFFFAGGAIIHVVGEYSLDPDGAAGYLWLGSGLNVKLRRWTFYGEGSILYGGDQNHGLGENWVFPFNPAMAAGIMFGF